MDSGLKALEVPRLDRASEVLPEAVGGEVTGSSDPSNPIDECWVYFDVHSDNLENTLNEFRIVVESALSVQQHLRLSLSINSNR